MKPVYVCVTVKNRYDLLGPMLRSAFTGTIQPSGIYVVDNGKQPERLKEALKDLPPVPLHVVDTEADPEPGQPQWSHARAWNWFMRNVPEERLLCNDDITFGPRSFEIILGSPGVYLDLFGCVVIRDECIDKVGFNDETISPGFYRYDDCDYLHRMALVGLYPEVVNAEIVHELNGTMHAYTTEEMIDYHHRMALAESNYVKKWGQPPQRGRNNQWV